MNTKRCFKVFEKLFMPVVAGWITGCGLFYALAYGLGNVGVDHNTWLAWGIVLGVLLIAAFCMAVSIARGE
jgi:uncharacterized membrane protein